MKRLQQISLYYWFLLILMVGLNIWLLYGKYQLNIQLKTQKALNAHTQPQKSLADKPIRYTRSFNTKYPFLLVAVFTDAGCNSCMINEIKFLNKWSKKQPQTLKVYYTGNIEEYLEGYGAKFSYSKIDFPDKLFNTPMIFGNPVVTVVDSNGVVQSIHTNNLSRPGSDLRRKNFYNRANSLFNAVGKP